MAPITVSPRAHVSELGIFPSLRAHIGRRRARNFSTSQSLYREGPKPQEIFPSPRASIEVESGDFSKSQSFYTRQELGIFPSPWASTEVIFHMKKLWRKMKEIWIKFRPIYEPWDFKKKFPVGGVLRVRVPHIFHMFLHIFHIFSQISSYLSHLLS